MSRIGDRAALRLARTLGIRVTNAHPSSLPQVRTYSPSPPPPPPPPALAANFARTEQCAMLRSVSRSSPLLSRPNIRPPVHRAPATSRAYPSSLIPNAEYVSTLCFLSRNLTGDSGPFVLSTSALRGAPRYPARVGLLAGPRHSPDAYPGYAGSIGHVRGFHATSKREFNPLPVLAAVLKVSSSHP